MRQRIIKKRGFSGIRNPEISERELKNRAVARKAAAEGMVLLKNEKGILPLAPGSRVALYGIGASRTIKGGTGSGDVNERERVSIYQGMKHAGFVITNEDWILDYDRRYEEARTAWRDGILEKTAGAAQTSGAFFQIYTQTPFVMPEGKAAEKTDADAAFFILSRTAGEGADRFAKEGDYFLTEQESGLLADICRFYENVIVAVNTGGLVDLSFLDTYENIRGLFQIVQPGMEGGNAFADVVSGRITPSGKLTDTWAYAYGDYPNAEHFSHNNDDVVNERYEEGIYVGYRYFDTFGIPVRYCFGYGLSYTDFEISTGKVSYSRNLMGTSGDSAGSEFGELSVSISVTNTGNRAGKEVVQVYVSCPYGKLEKEYRRLTAFGKTRELRSGETQEMTLTFSLDTLASYDESEPGWILEKGMYGIWIGNSLEDARLSAAVELGQSAVLVRTEHICSLREELREFRQDASKQEERYWNCVREVSEKELPVLPVCGADLTEKTVVYTPNAKIFTPESRKFVDTLTLDQLIRLSSGDPGKAQGGNLGAAGISVPGSAGETHHCAEAQNLPGIVLADGPAGLRLMQYYNVDQGKIVTMPFQFSIEGGIFCPDTDRLPGERYYQYCTAIPVGTLLAQTWNMELIEETGEMIGGEMVEFGITLWLAPGMNIHRNPLCGRNFEYYSEDPLLSGRMAAAMTKGVQRVPGCGTTIKHFACNNQEDNRKDSNSILSERALREIYLKGFEIAVKTAQPMAVMTSYNLVNGVHAANSYDLCTKAARNEWGFQGLIMTDWTTTEGDTSCTASGCIRAGNDLIMPGSRGDHDNLYKELAEGTLSQDELRACISRLVQVIWQSDRFE